MRNQLRVYGALLLMCTFVMPLRAEEKEIKEEDQKYRYPAIYPFVPKNPRAIFNDIITVSEDVDFEGNFMNMLKYSAGGAKQQPWTSSYWPLTKGTIADPYENSLLGYNLDIGWVSWKNNYKKLRRRGEKVHEKIKNNFDELSQKDLDKLAASEKYDLLLGDMSFDLTNRLVKYMHDWGSKKENAFITRLNLVGEDSLVLAQEYVSNGYYKDVEEAFQKSWNLKPTLSVRKALDLVKRKRFSSPDDAFAEALDFAKREGQNYVLAKKNKRMAAWEGICNGWSTAAGLVPRPKRVVSFDLPNGKKLNFYPSDIKGLVALYYVNSLIQDGAYVDQETKLPTSQGVVGAGLRCNLGNAKKDVWGRFYDHEKDPFSGKQEPRCVGVHPATWHLGVVNVMGKQQRSFIVERKIGKAVDNHPMSKYKMRYYNPNKDGKLGYFDPNDSDSELQVKDVIEPIDERDQFKQLRHPLSKYIVGVEMVMVYQDYMKPNRKETDSADDDAEVEKKMYYDLELDKDYRIIGGQWRAVPIGFPEEDSELNHNQPDFFWAVTKNYKATGWFDDVKDIESWSDTSKLPPESWLANAKEAHAFEYQNLIAWGNAANCKVVNIKTSKIHDTYCEMSVNKPQPLVNVINLLVNKAK